ncbi:hypothetical protein [Streptomyces sp. SM14]|uniref:DUF7224 domain-containing protein n=2 Tax=unclassified Streptomyces TaxID=2593676 RepID=UPI000CD56959|nr:hypothetical protein [Streptomyces sp. SM14]
MIFRLRLRANAAVAATVPLLGLVLLYVLAEEAGGGPDGYWTAATAKAASALMFIAPVVAACAAWEAGRLRRAGVGGGAPVRGGVRIAAASLTPVLLLGLLALAVALAGVRAQMGAAPGWPDPPILGAAVATLGGYLLVGYALGLWLPPAASLPVALVGGYLWQVYPPALEPLWLRHLTQPARGCCVSVDTVATGGVAGPVLTAVALAAVALAATTVSRHAPRRGSPAPAGLALVVVPALLVAAAAGAGAVRAVSDLGPDAVVARPPAEMVCTDAAAVRVCVWPEHEARLEETAQVVREAVTGLTLVGVTPPDLVTEHLGPSGEPASDTWWTVTVRGSAGFTTDDIRAGLAADLAMSLLDRHESPRAADCPADAVKAADEGFEAADQLLAWLAVRAGMDPGQAHARFDPQLWTAVGPVLDGDDAAQAAWYRSALDRAGCAPW